MRFQNSFVLSPSLSLSRSLSGLGDFSGFCFVLFVSRSIFSFAGHVTKNIAERSILTYVMALKVNSMFIGMTLVILGGHGAWLWVQQRKDIVGNEGGKEFPLITIARIATTGDPKPKDSN